MELKIEYDKEFRKKSKKILSEKFIEKAFIKAAQIIEKHGLEYNSLKAKKISPKVHNIWQFRLTKKYRCLFHYDEAKQIVTFKEVTNHL
jgi:mRNA-degrading endonuclease RelE of RelBE toxin-antitoxin system